MNRHCPHGARPPRTSVWAQDSPGNRMEMVETELAEGCHRFGHDDRPKTGRVQGTNEEARRLRSTRNRRGGALSGGEWVCKWRSEDQTISASSNPPTRTDDHNHAPLPLHAARIHPLFSKRDKTPSARFLPPTTPRHRLLPRSAAHVSYRYAPWRCGADGGRG